MGFLKEVRFLRKPKVTTIFPKTFVLGDDGLGSKGRLALVAALGTGVVIGAAGLVVYQVSLANLFFEVANVLLFNIQRMSQNVGLRVTGPDFSQELATLTTHIAALRADLEQLKEGNNSSGVPALKSALKRESKYGGKGDAMSVECLASSEQLELPELGRRRNQSWGSGLTVGSASSSGTEYFSAYSGSDEENGSSDQGLQMKVKVKVSTQSVETEMLARLDDLMEGSKEQQTLALSQLVTAVQEGEERRNPNLLWRLCKAQYLCSVLENQDDNKEAQHKLIMDAIKSGEEALALDTNNSEAHKWFAIALGSRGEFGGVKEKILDGFEFKKHIDLAAELNPRDHITQHLQGRFCYEVSQVFNERYCLQTK